MLPERSGCKLPGYQSNRNTVIERALYTATTLFFVPLEVTFEKCISQKIKRNMRGRGEESAVSTQKKNLESQLSSNVSDGT